MTLMGNHSNNYSSHRVVEINGTPLFQTCTLCGCHRHHHIFMCFCFSPLSGSPDSHNLDSLWYTLTGFPMFTADALGLNDFHLAPYVLQLEKCYLYGWGNRGNGSGLSAADSETLIKTDSSSNGHAIHCFQLSDVYDMCIGLVFSLLPFTVSLGIHTAVHHVTYRNGPARGSARRFVRFWYSEALLSSVPSRGG